MPAMNVDEILKTLDRHQVACLLIGGVNFLMQHAPVLTYDIDFWIEDTADNRRCCERALAELQAQWGASGEEWGPVAEKKSGWLDCQGVYCLASPYGAIDIFRSVAGLRSWSECRARARTLRTGAGHAVAGLSDEDMLQCQLALSENERKPERIRALRKRLERMSHD